MQSPVVSLLPHNVCNQRLAANRLSMPNDSAASLLHRLVRDAVGFPRTRSLGHRGERFRPVVKSGRIKVSAIRPNEGVNLWVQPNLLEDFRVTQRPEQRSGQHGLEIDVAHYAVAERDSQPVRTDHLEVRDAVEGMNHGST